MANINNKTECPEGFHKCVALEMFKDGVGIMLEQNGKSYTVSNNEGETAGQIYCSNPVPCISKYGVKVLEDIAKRREEIIRSN